MELTTASHGLTTLNRDVSNCYRISIREYPTGDVECSAIRFDSETRLGNSSKKERIRDKKKDMDIYTLSKSQARARKVVKQKALMMQADRLLTLTFRENLTDIQEAWSVFKYFSKLMRWRYGERFLYITVPEYQKRGAVHFHLAVKGFYHANTVRRLWHRAVGNRGGNIDITNPQNYGIKSWNPKRIARYLSKYITKNDSVEFNKRRYSSSSTLLPPKPRFEWLALGVPVTQVLCQIIESLTHRPVSVVWHSDNYFFDIHLVTT